MTGICTQCYIFFLSVSSDAAETDSSSLDSRSVASSTKPKRALKDSEAEKPPTSLASTKR